MPIRLSEKDHLSIPFDIDKQKKYNNRERTFITNCINELKTKGETICFNKEQIKTIKAQIDLTEIRYDERNDCYYLFSKA